MKLINKILQSNNEKYQNEFNELLNILINNINSLKKDLDVYDSLYKNTSFINEEIFDSIILDLQYIDYDKLKLISKYENLLDDTKAEKDIIHFKNLILSIKSYFDFLLTSFEEKDYHDVSAVTIKNEMIRVFNLKKYTTRELDL